MTTKTFQLASSDYTTANYLKSLGYLELAKSSFLQPDFVVLPGGSDVSPALYFQTKEPGTINTPQTDYEEYAAIIGARLEGIPLVGICKGAQFLHVSCGGTLIQHLATHRSIPHKVTDRDGNNGFLVNSFHHQGIPPAEVQPGGLYEDYLLSEDLCVVEAIFSKQKKLLGVQWHPEYPGCPDTGKDYFKQKLSELLGE